MPAAQARSPISADLDAPDDQLAFAAGWTGAPASVSSRASRSGSGVRTVVPACLQGGQRASGDQTAVVDDDDLVGQVLDLGEQVAGDEDGAAGCGTFAQQVTQPADALGVEPVAGFVEHQDGWVAEQRGRQAEPLPHPQRVGTDVAVARRAPARPARAARRCAPSGCRRRPRGPAGGCGRCDRGGTRWARGPRRPSGQGRPGRGTGCPPIVAWPWSAEARSSRIFMVVDLPAPLGPRNPVTRPGRTVKRQVVDDDVVTVALGDLLDLQGVHLVLLRRCCGCVVRRSRGLLGSAPSGS